MLSELLSLRAHSAKELKCHTPLPSIAWSIPDFPPVLLTGLWGIFQGGDGGGGLGCKEWERMAWSCPLYVNYFLGFLICPLFWTTTITLIQMTPKSDSSQKHISICIDVYLGKST